ncbi:FtsZ/tubulin family protein [Alicyclobacillus mengziensis]|uniref:Tubulin/FtsZ GTPase domain-containing protein n=1 Tax=Alicyclobacillus mengziensis TaxID=2931921 RepID=A0A9X7W486_9BACL|nr:hypothetical protein [Alicyclobacillus mengziensis]QSO50115.1 hypothetical protein JZ786_24680 [Alicyclobacillus mengziensis]
MFKFAFIGLGQYGGRQVEAFLKESHEYVGVAVNTATNDLDGLVHVSEGNRLSLSGSSFGAGRTPEIAHEAIMRPENVQAFAELTSKVTADADFIWLCAGLGGGTGTGVLQALLDHQATAMWPQNVGLIVTLPRDDDGVIPKINAVRALQSISDAINAGLIGSVLIVDNDRFYKQFAEERNTGHWQDLSNEYVARTLHEANQIALKSGKANVDRKDLEKMFATPGCLALGAASIKRLELEDVYTTVRNSIGKGFFTTGYRLDEAMYYALCFTLDEQGDKIRSSQYERGLTQNLTQVFPHALDSYYGYYTGAQNRILSIITGLGFPERVYQLQDKIKDVQAPKRREFAVNVLPDIAGLNSLLKPREKPQNASANPFLAATQGGTVTKARPNPFEAFKARP